MNTNYFYGSKNKLCYIIGRQIFLYGELRRMSLIIEDIANNEFHRAILMEYFERRNCTQNLETLKEYELCKQIIANSNLLHEQEKIDKLVTISPSYEFECKIRNEIEEFKALKIDNNLKMNLRYLCKTLLFEIEKSFVWKQFVHQVQTKHANIKEIMKDVCDKKIKERKRMMRN